MKEMIYKPEQDIDILAEGKIKNRQYYIISYGTHPCAYVEVSEKEMGGKDYHDFDIDCHGGLTFSGSLRKINAKGIYIGWDYAHYEDLSGFDYRYPIEFRAGGKKWTTAEIFEEVKYVIEQLGNKE